MYNNESNQGMLIIKSDISDYLNRIYTADGKYPNGICLAPLSKSIIANSVVGHHLYELFNIDDSNTLINVVNGILDSLSIKSLQIDEISIDVIMIMLESEITKVLKHVYNYTDEQVKRHAKLPMILNSIKYDLLFISRNL